MSIPENPSDVVADNVRTRIRIAHTHTKSGGYQHETTVEVEWSGAGEADPDALERVEMLLGEVDRLGREESRRRDDLDWRDGGRS